MLVRVCAVQELAVGPTGVEVKDFCLVVIDPDEGVIVLGHDVRPT
jgi:hypothetical protein